MKFLTQKAKYGFGVEQVYNSSWNQLFSSIQKK